MQCVCVCMCLNICVEQCAINTSFKIDSLASVFQGIFVLLLPGSVHLNISNYGEKCQKCKLYQPAYFFDLV